MEKYERAGEPGRGRTSLSWLSSNKYEASQIPGKARQYLAEMSIMGQLLREINAPMLCQILCDFAPHTTFANTFSQTYTVSLTS